MCHTALKCLWIVLKQILSRNWWLWQPNLLSGWGLHPQTPTYGIYYLALELNPSENFYLCPRKKVSYSTTHNYAFPKFLRLVHVHTSATYLFPIFYATAGKSPQYRLIHPAFLAGANSFIIHRLRTCSVQCLQAWGYMQSTARQYTHQN